MNTYKKIETPNCLGIMSLMANGLTARYWRYLMS